jgi:serine/threonine-protein kinase
MASALELDPLSLVINSIIGWILYLARRFRESVDQLTSIIEMDGNFAIARYYLGLVYIELGQYGEALNQFAKARQISNDNPAAIAGFAAALGLSGDATQANKVLGELEALSTTRYVEPYLFAATYLILENKVRGLRWLERALEDRSPRLSNIKVDPVFDRVRSDARFIKLLGRFGFRPMASSATKH